ncbi:MAG: sulfite exporter TauE/SafE family protein [Kangiellaceae bacterium]|nr:sulfite exporter TauE/SafE family protein [Kangiellaceae bacterium]MCW8998909.1 sulfite exporter TauE/SafE family protein [Kangiellaceae bacterium]
MIELTVIFILAGICAGFLAGLLGIGGGFVVVPVLIWALPFAQVPQELVPHFAIGTSLLCICVTSVSSARAHHKRTAVEWPLFGITTPGLILGALLGAWLASILTGRWLIILFVIGAMTTAIYLLSGHQPKAHPDESKWPFFGYGIFTGVVSALIGIGGGSVLVPFLVYKGRQIVKAVGTAAACGFPIALFGALGYAGSGWNQVENVEFAIGYLYWPAFLGIVVFSSLTAPLGAKVAHYISEKKLRRVFAAFLFFTSGQILYSHWFS